MPTCIFYEAETVDETVVARGLAEAGPGVHVHVAQADAVWLADGITPRRVPPRRSEAFRRELMASIDRTMARARAKALTIGGVDVLEVARYEWLEALSRSAYRTWVVDQLRREHGGEVHVVAASPPPAPQSLFARVRREVGAAVRLLKPRYTRPGAATVLFAEVYPAGAKVSASIADRLDVPYRFVVADASVGPSGSQTVAAAATRPARLVSLWRAARCVRAAIKAIDDPHARRAAAGTWRQAAMHIALIDDIGRRCRPAVVATSSYTASLARAAVLTGRHGGWAQRSVYLQHGILFHYNYGTHLVHDRYVVWGSRDRDALVARGVSGEHVTVVGSPTFEHLAAAVQAPRATAPHDGFEVLYLPSRTAGGMVSAAMASAMLDAIVAAVQGLDGTRLTVKVHPRDQSPLFDGLSELAVRVLRDADPIEAILAADVVVSATSTVGIEACALDRPAVILAFPGVEIPPAYEEFDAVLLAHDRVETADALRRIAGDEQTRQRLAAGRHRLVAEMFAGLEPGAPDRAAAALMASL